MVARIMTLKFLFLLEHILASTMMTTYCKGLCRVMAPAHSICSNCFRKSVDVSAPPPPTFCWKKSRHFPHGDILKPNCKFLASRSAKMFGWHIHWEPQWLIDAILLLCSNVLQGAFNTSSHSFGNSLLVHAAETVVCDLCEAFSLFLFLSVSGKMFLFPFEWAC